MSKYLKTNGVTPLYLVFDVFWYVNGCFEEINKNKYLMLVPTNESKEKIKKYEELRIKMRNLIRWITKNLDDCDENIWKSNLIQIANHHLIKQ